MAPLAALLAAALVTPTARRLCSRLPPPSSGSPGAAPPGREHKGAAIDVGRADLFIYKPNCRLTY